MASRQLCTARSRLIEGVVQQSNFHNYPMLRMADDAGRWMCILSRVRNIPKAWASPGLPPLAPAVANAVFKATGQRLRHLPLRLS